MGAALVAAFLVVCLQRLPIWPTWEERSAQSVWSLLETTELDQRWVVVDIDETSLRRVGAWPWSRETVARLLERILQAKASVVLVDAVFPDERDGDAHLARVLSSQQIVLAQLFSDAARDGRLANQGLLRGDSSVSGQCPSPWVSSSSYLANAARLGQFPAGHISPSVDQDGTVRHFAPLVCFQNQQYPSLILSGLSVVAGQTSAWQWQASSAWWGPAGWVTHATLPGIQVPVDQDGLARVAYTRSRSAYAAIPAYEFLHQAVLPDLSGAFVIVGASAFGLADAVPTPQSGLSTGMEVHLQIASALLDQRLPYTPQAAWLLELVWALVWVFALAGLMRYKESWTMGLLVWGLVHAVLVWSLFLVLLQRFNWWLPPLGLMVFGLLYAAFLALMAYQQNLHKKRLVSAHLASFVDPSVAQSLEFSEVANQVVAHEKHITVMVVDIVGFTRYSDTHTNQETVNLLQTFFAELTAMAQAHGGSVDKFIGDAVMILFNADGHCHDHAAGALRCTQAVLQWNAQYLRAQDLGLDVAIGVSTGHALVGQFGSAQRRTHTALGTMVTKAFRLEKLCRDLSQRAIVAGETIAQIRDQEPTSLPESFLFEATQYQRFGEVPLPGFTGVHEVYVVA